MRVSETASRAAVAALTLLAITVGAGGARCAAAGLGAFAASNDNDPPTLSRSAALRNAIEQLEAEAADFLDTGHLARGKPDFANSFAHTLNPADVVRVVVNVHDRKNPTVDGYVRWQMLSFGPDLSSLPTDQIKALAMNLPVLLRSPAIDTRLHQEFESMAARAGRNADVRRELESRWKALQARVRAVRLLNESALRFREAVTTAQPVSGLRRPALLLFDLHGRIASGWPTRTIKTRITLELKKRKLEESFSWPKRIRLIEFVQSMPDIQTRAIRDITFYARQPAEIHYSTYTVRGTDVKRWTAYLNGHDP